MDSVTPPNGTVPENPPACLELVRSSASSYTGDSSYTGYAPDFDRIILPGHPG